MFWDMRSDLSRFILFQRVRQLIVCCYHEWNITFWERDCWVCRRIISNVLWWKRGVIKVTCLLFGLTILDFIFMVVVWIVTHFVACSFLYIRVSTIFLIAEYFYYNLRLVAKFLVWIWIGSLKVSSFSVLLSVTLSLIFVIATLLLGFYCF